MILKLTGVYDDNLGTQAAKRIEGTRVDNGEEYSKKFFANDKALRTQLDEFGVGDVVNVKMVKDGKFWNIGSFSVPSPESVETAKKNGKYGGISNPQTAGGGSPATTSGGGAPASDKMSKAEWAAKDRAKEESIARAVAIKLAMDNTKVGTNPAAVIAEAYSYLPYLLGETVGTTDTEDNDPLDPDVG